MRKEDLKQKNYEGCLNLCIKAGERMKNCIDGCAVAIKQIYTDKTKLSVGTRNFNTYIETESNVKGWLLILIFIIVVTLLIWKFIL